MEHPQRSLRLGLPALLGAALIVAGCARPAAHDGAQGRAEGHAPSTAAAAERAPPGSSTTAAPPAPTASSSAATATAEIEPLDAPAEPFALAVEGFRDAVVSAPRGARERRPVIVALHGNFDRPEWQCEIWREVAGPRPFILCPRGVPRGDAPKSWDRWEYGSVTQVTREIDAGLAALSVRFPEHVHIERPAFVGFSLGAILGRFLVAKAPQRFSVLALVEGGYESWPKGTARAFSEPPGARVLFVCGQASCAASSKAAARSFEPDRVRIEHARGEGHTYGEGVAKLTKGAWPWLVAGDPRFGEP
jgi:poly(3-hydroxybutyrate) depolymerase